MGGRGDRGLSPRDIKQLEDMAKKKIRDAMPQRRSVFISFAKEDLNEINLLRGQAKNENSELEFIDRSLQEPFDSKNAEYIRRGIRERIRQSSVTVVYVTDNTAHSRWVDWEVRESISLGKGVIAMYKGESPPNDLPAAVEEFKIKLIPWDHKVLLKAIEDAARKR